jgi:hypothetical protein
LPRLAVAAPGPDPDGESPRMRRFPVATQGRAGDIITGDGTTAKPAR